MADSYKKLMAEISGNVQQLGQLNPDMIKGFQDLNGSAIRDGVLDKKTKELIALALGVAARCDGCIAFHTKKSIDLGMTKEELAEILSVAVFMGGGPSLMYAAEAIKAFDEFSA